MRVLLNSVRPCRSSVKTDEHEKVKSMSQLCCIRISFLNGYFYSLNEGGEKCIRQHQEQMFFKHLRWSSTQQTP